MRLVPSSFPVGLLAGAVFPSVSATAAEILLNEVLYDPAGADAGLEFVEVSARSGGDPDASLAGWVLETGNGARPGEWSVAWIGGPADRLREGIFLIGEEGVEPWPDAVVDLDLQNGPDACRWRGPGGAVDVLGWGKPLDPSLFEGSPAEDVSGLSLARRPDGLDSNHNARDFRGAEPSPGAFNSPEFDLVVEVFVPPPAGWSEGAAWSFAWTVRNLGRTAGPVEARALCGVHPDEILVVARPPGSGLLDPGETVQIERQVAPPPGVHVPRSDPTAPPGFPWRGFGADLVVSEVLNRPRPPGAEWIEIHSIAGRSLDLAAFHLEDAAGTRAPLSGVLAPGRYAVVTVDSAALRARWEIPGRAVVVEAAPWPSLNHSASPGEVAERVVLRVGDLESVAASVPGGADEAISWEIVSRHLDPDDPASWSASLDRTGGTPGRENSRDGDRALGPVTAALSAHPSPFVPSRDGTTLLVLRPARPAPACRMTVFDASGVRVASLAPWRVSPGEHRALWDGGQDGGAPAGLGLYIVRAEAPGSPPASLPLVLVR